MNDYLTNLAARGVGATAIRPRLAARFEPSSPAERMSGDAPENAPLEVEEVVTAQPPAVPHKAPSIHSVAATPVEPVPPVTQDRPKPAESAPPIRPTVTRRTGEPAAVREGAVPPAIQPATPPRRPEAVQALAESAEPDRATSAPPESVAPPRVVMAAPPVPVRATPAVVKHPTAAPTPALPPPAGAPLIRVTIGRIDVRAASPSQPERTPVAPNRPSLSLADYLKRREEGRR